MLHVVHPWFSPRVLPAQVCIEIIAFGLHASRKIRMVKPTSQSSTTDGIALNLHSWLSYGHSRSTRLPTTNRAQWRLYHRFVPARESASARSPCRASRAAFRPSQLVASDRLASQPTYSTNVSKGPLGGCTCG